MFARVLAAGFRMVTKKQYNQWATNFIGHLSYNEKKEQLLSMVSSLADKIMLFLRLHYWQCCWLKNGKIPKLCRKISQMCLEIMVFYFLISCLEILLFPQIYEKDQISSLLSCTSFKLWRVFKNCAISYDYANKSFYLLKSFRRLSIHVQNYLVALLLLKNFYTLKY